MKRISVFFAVVILVLFCTMCNVAFAKKQKAPTTKHKIEFTTKDNFILVGDLYLANPATNKPLVVMLHSFGVSAKVWGNIAEELRQKGYNCLAMDIRGHGRSVYNDQLKLKSRYRFTANDWQKLPNDVIESINHIKSNYSKINTENFIFIGADIGASAGLIAGNTLKNKPEKFVLISPMLNFKGLYIPIVAANYTTTRFLVLLSKTDKILFNFYSHYDPIIKIYPLGGPGNHLLRVNPDSTSDIVDFVTK